MTAGVTVADNPELDPARWVTLVIVLLAAFIVVLDNTVLNVSIPTILRDFHTTLPALEWVVTGYALMFATLLIIGGRLGDIYGHRRIFIIGTALFGVGSFIASVSTGVPELVLGEAVIEGIGASLMLPATLALLSGTFQGRERATAFAAWGASAGVAAACGPVVGGFLTTNYSWRWSFRINVIIAPLAIIGAIVFMRDNVSSRKRVKLDFLGAALVAVGMFLFVFALSEGGTYGWLKPVESFSIGGTDLWPGTWSISMIPVVLAVAVAVLAVFYVVERSKERRKAAPLFEFAHLRLATYRYGLLTGLVVAMGQLGLSFVLPVFLQEGRHLSAAQNGLWQLPTGIFVILGAQLGGRLIRSVGTTVVVRAGFVLYAGGIVYLLHAVNLNLTALGLLPGLALYGTGIGFAGAQLTNVVLSEIPNESSGVASGANTTVRQVGAALGVAVIGSLLTAQTVSQTVGAFKRAPLPANVKAQAIAGVHALGPNYAPPASVSGRNAALLQSALEHGVTTGTRWALAFAVVVIAIGTALSFLIPRDAVPAGITAHTADSLEPLEPLDPDPALL
ncbi:MAG TPA: MFS transporter [Acidimicrobiia bacterium]|nr:MFS transporter [Acidimicrobiia bacterium]